MSMQTGVGTKFASFVGDNARLLKRILQAMVLFSLLILPLSTTTVFTNLMISMLIFGLFALGFDLIMGYTGMVSFGHALYFGGGAYAVALTPVYLGIENLWLVLTLAVLGMMVLGLIVAVISIRSQGIYFALLTIAWAQIGYILVYNLTDITGGSNGTSVPITEMALVPGTLEFSLIDSLPMYYLTLVSLLVVFFLLYRLVHSPYGAVLKGIRENPERIEYLGYDEKWYRVSAFTISAGVAGLAGALLALFTGFISPGLMALLVNGEVIIWTVLGGQGTLVGPVIGASLVTYVEHSFSTEVSWWLIPVGALFIVMMIFLPHGLYGKVRDYVSNLGDSE